MSDTNSKTGFVTNAFAGALAENDEMNKDVKGKRKKRTPVSKGENESFTTDAFREALKINEEMNKK